MNGVGGGLLSAVAVYPVVWVDSQNASVSVLGWQTRGANPRLLPRGGILLLNGDWTGKLSPEYLVLGLKARLFAALW